MNTWDHYGKHDPYYGVLSSEEFRSAHMNESTRLRFFELGREQVDQFIAMAEERCGPVKFGTALDYGCGVGRLSKTLATRFERVIAIDRSHDMLDEAKRNLREHANVSFQHIDAIGTEPIDFLMSKIVFQHIVPSEGLAILERIVPMLSNEGIGVIDFPIAYSGGALRGILRELRKFWPFGEPVIQMYRYDLSSIEDVLRRAGMKKIAVQRVAVPMFEKAIIAFCR